VLKRTGSGSDKKLVLCVTKPFVLMGQIQMGQTKSKVDMQQLNKPIILKFGGSAITFKDKSPPEVNRPVLEQAAKELTSAKNPVVLVLGGGAHGHQAAHSHGYGSSDTPKTTLIRGISSIRHNMSLLALEVESILSNHGLEAVVLPPFSFVRLNDGAIEEFPIGTIRKCLESSIITIVHGDVCFDESRGASILSGDTIVSHLANELDAQSIYLGTNVDGLFDDNPVDNPSAALITELSLSNRDQVLFRTGTSSSTDVTGGMSRKITDLLSLSNTESEIAIFNLMIPGRLQALLENRQTICTRVTF
jgi:isopentenyl phosphate kinase